MKLVVIASTIGLVSGDCRSHSEGTCLSPAFNGDCKAPETHSYGKELPVQMRQQWDDSDGYCGSLATQTILLSQGAYVSQDHVRRAVPGTDRGPGTGAELYYENIGPAMDTLKWRHDDWDWRHEQQPQWKNYLVWMKKHIINGEGIVWMIKDAAFELKQVNYTNEGLLGPAFGHEEPVFGIHSKHPLTDTDTYYDDDVLVHGSDYCAGPDVEGPRNYRLFSSLPDEYMQGNCAKAQGTIGQYPCINENQNLGFAVLGPVEEEKSIRVHLKLDRFDEPDNNEMNLRDPVDVKGTVTVEGPLTVGETYTILRWNDFTKVPTTGKYFDSDFDDSHSFVASSDTFTFADPTPFKSTGTTYYRCVKGSPTWNAWKKNHGREYSSDMEEVRRATFDKNMAFAAEQQKLNPEAVFGSTQFSDLTPEEFHAMYSKSKPQDKTHVKLELPIFIPDKSTPVNQIIDWEKEGAVTTVKNQGSFGTCWSFATSGTMEGQEFVVGGRKPVDLAQQMLIDCCSECYGHPDKSMKWILNNGGMDTAESYGPYQGNKGTCKHAQATVGEQIVSMQVVQQEADFMAALQNGPFHVAIDDASLQTYRGGVMTNTICEDPGNHDVLLVGAGEENGVKYWRVKNSWGTSFGESGYFRVIRDKAAMCLGKPNSFGSPATTAVGKPAASIV